MEEEKTWPQLLRTVGPSEEDVRNAAEAGAKRFEAHKASFLEKITEEVSKCINATNADPSGIVAEAIKNSRYFVLAGTQVVKNIASLAFANEFPPGTLTANDWDLYHATEKCTSGETWKLDPKKNFKVTNKYILGQHDLSVPVNVVTGKNLSLEALVSGFDINVGMGGVSFARDAQGKLQVDDVFIHPQLWHFLVASHTLRIINFRTPAVSMIRLLNKAVEQRSLKVDVGEKYTLREAEGGDLIPPSGVEKLMKLRGWSGCPVANVRLVDHGRYWKKFI